MTEIVGMGKTETPVGKSTRIACLAMVALILSALVLAVAPLLMPDSYSWVTHTTSESAAQGVEGAWLARTGFTLFGVGVLLLAVISWRRLGSLASAMFAAFGLMMLATAAFSHRPWESGVPFDRTEDLLHSIAATGIGFAFVFSILAVMIARRRVRAFDMLAIAASVVIPLSMIALADYSGILQRGMFVIAYAWFGMEIVRGTREEPA